MVDVFIIFRSRDRETRVADRNEVSFDNWWTVTLRKYVVFAG